MNSANVVSRATCLFASLIFSASVAQAGPMVLYMVTNPATTAGAGIAPIPSGGSSLVVSSSRSGSGTFHLYAIDDVTGSFGIRNYSITLGPGVGGAITSITHRSPNGQYDDDPSFGNGSGPFGVGFSDLRSGANVNPIVAGQGLANSPQIGGFGITASNFGAKIGANAQSYSGVTSGQWGNYADSGTSGLVFVAGGDFAQRNALLIAEGQYTGGAPTFVGASIAYFTNSQLTASAFAPQYVFIYSPEPTTAALVGLAMVGGLGLCRRRA